MNFRSTFLVDPTRYGLDIMALAYIAVFGSWPRVQVPPRVLSFFAFAGRDFHCATRELVTDKLGVVPARRRPATGSTSATRGISPRAAPARRSTPTSRPRTRPRVQVPPRLSFFCFLRSPRAGHVDEARREHVVGGLGALEALDVAGEDRVGDEVGELVTDKLRTPPTTQRFTST